MTKYLPKREMTNISIYGYMQENIINKLLLPMSHDMYLVHTVPTLFIPTYFKLSTYTYS